MKVIYYFMNHVYLITLHNCPSKQKIFLEEKRTEK
jgi:hypothetical protein